MDLMTRPCPYILFICRSCMKYGYEQPKILFEFYLWILLRIASLDLAHDTVESEGSVLCLSLWKVFKSSLIRLDPLFCLFGCLLSFFFRPSFIISYHCKIQGSRCDLNISTIRRTERKEGNNETNTQNKYETIFFKTLETTRNTSWDLSRKMRIGQTCLKLFFPSFYSR